MTNNQENAPQKPADNPQEPEDDQWTEQDIERTMDRIRHMFEPHMSSPLMMRVCEISCAKAAEGIIRD